MLALFKCSNPECGVVFEWAIIRPFVRRNYEFMIQQGTLDPEAVTGNPLHPVRYHPKYYTPQCPVCGSKSYWIFHKRWRQG